MDNSAYVVPGFRPSRAPDASARAGKLRRLATMPWTEIAGRSRQEALKWIDSLAGANEIDVRSVLEEHAPSLATESAVLDMLRDAAPSRFFAGVDQPVDAIRLVPAHREEVLSAADEVMESRFDLLGYRTLWFGDPIDWHLDPILGRRAPNVHWSRLNPLDPASVGDSKVVWELNRHQWLVRVAQAYSLTGDPRYADACLNAIDSWIRANPPGMGVNWSSSLEVSYRLMSWSWVLLLLRQADALTSERAATIVAAIWMHAHHVARYLSHYFSPNTHLTGEALGLFYAGTLFPEFDTANSWRDLGARILVEQSAAQTCGDGVHFERSTCYHRYTVETYQQFLLLAERNDVAVPSGVADRVRRMIEFVLAIRQPDGSLPEIGDADGGSLLPVVRRQQCDPSGVLAIGAAMFHRPDFAWAAGGAPPDLYWLMGADGIKKFNAVASAEPSGPASRAFPAGGYVVLRNGWAPDAHQMTVDVGPLGCSFAAGHGHADLLSIVCSMFGEPVLVDAGTYCYTPEPEWRNYFRGTGAHNTLRVSGRDQAEPDGPFSWHSKPRVVLREWRASAECDFVDAQHEAYDGLIHRRRVLFVKPGYWVVIDDVRGQTPFLAEFERIGQKRGLTPYTPSFSLDLAFQFAPMDVRLDRDTWARAITPGGNTLWVGSFASGPSRASIKCGELAPIRGWISTDYGQRVPAPMLVYACETSLPWRNVTLLLPVRGESKARPFVQPLYDDQQLPICLELESRGESIFIDDDDVFRTQNPAPRT